jgi:hypothetical protein
MTIFVQVEYLGESVLGGTKVQIPFLMLGQGS